MTDERDEARLRERVEASYRGAPIEAQAARERLAARLRELPAPRPLHGALSWWPRLVPYRLQPLAAAGAMLALIAVGAWLGSWATRGTTARGGAALAKRSSSAAPGGVLSSNAQAASMTRATFGLMAPGASRVSLVGDFNGWDPEATPLRRAASGDLWVTDLPLPRGVHLYAFVVNATEWIPDPAAPLAPKSAFGTPASVVVVGEPVPS